MFGRVPCFADLRIHRTRETQEVKKTRNSTEQVRDPHISYLYVASLTEAIGLLTELIAFIAFSLCSVEFRVLLI